MGFIKNWDVADIARQVNSASGSCRNPYTDGFTGWSIKQDLYQIKWIVDEAIHRCPDFAPEDEWLKEQEQKKIIRILKNDR
jgi:hypothetical protein